jgi:hypothetical protein
MTNITIIYQDDYKSGFVLHYRLFFDKWDEFRESEIRRKFVERKAALLGQLLTCFRELLLCNVLLVAVLVRCIGSSMKLRRQICLPRIKVPSSHS